MRVQGDIERNERGAMAIAIAIMTLVIGAVAMIVVDAGAIYEERRDLQTGAEFAALEVATRCAAGDLSCPDSVGAQPFADSRASANANDLAATVNAADIVFSPAECSGLPNEVRVTAHTEDAGPNVDGDTGTVDHWFARLFGNAGTAVSADACAAWGNPGGAGALPITFSVCEWDDMTGGGTVWGVYNIIYLHNTTGGGGDIGGNPNAGECEFGPGQDIDGSGDRGPGGFGYLESTNCYAEINAGGFVEGRPGTGNPQQVLGCSLGGVLHQQILIPIFDDLVDSSYCPGTHACYHIYGFASFYVEDVDFNGMPWANNENICASQDRCLGGWFDRFVSLEEGLDILNGGGGPDLGVYVVVLTG